MALTGSLLFALTVTPLLSFWLLRAAPEGETTAVIRRGRRAYAPWLNRAVARPVWPVLIVVGIFAVSLLAGSRLGIEFVPRLEEGDLAVQVWRLPSISLSESVATALDIERVLRRFPEVTQVVTHTCSPEVATDVMGVEMSDVFIILKPQRDWVTAHSRNALIEAMKRQITEPVPGVGRGFTQPMEMPFNELSDGLRSGLAVKIFWPDLDILKQQAERAARALQQVPGAADVKVEQVAACLFYASLSIAPRSPVMGSRLKKCSLSFNPLMPGQWSGRSCKVPRGSNWSCGSRTGSPAILVP